MPALSSVCDINIKIADNLLVSRIPTGMTKAEAAAAKAARQSNSFEYCIFDLILIEREKKSSAKTTLGWNRKGRLRTNKKLILLL